PAGGKLGRAPDTEGAPAKAGADARPTAPLAGAAPPAGANAPTLQLTWRIGEYKLSIGISPIGASSGRFCTAGRRSRLGGMPGTCLRRSPAAQAAVRPLPLSAVSSMFSVAPAPRSFRRSRSVNRDATSIEPDSRPRLRRERWGSSRLQITR